MNHSVGRPLGRRLVRRRIAVAVVAALLAPVNTSAQQLTLQINPRRVTFASADPDTTPVVYGQPIVVTYRIRSNQNNPWQITLLADGDLIDGASTVDISNVSWTATPAPPFQNGTLNKTVEQVLASGNGNVNPARTGSVVFQLANSWSYPSGVYSQTVVITLITP